MAGPAEGAYGEPSAFMMLESQLIGMLSLGAFIARRRAPLFTRRLTGPVRRRMIWLLLASGALEALYAVLFYLVIDQIGACSPCSCRARRRCSASPPACCCSRSS